MKAYTLFSGGMVLGFLAMGMISCGIGAVGPGRERSVFRPYPVNVSPPVERETVISEKSSFSYPCRMKHASKREAEIVHEAVNRARHFFKVYGGHETNTFFNVQFSEVVTTGATGCDRCALKGKKVFALYNSRTNWIKIRHFKRSLPDYTKMLGIFPFDREFYTSIVTHEVAHRFFHTISEESAETMDRSFSEFIACCAEIETMKEPHKSEVLSLWPAERLPSVFAINSIVWMADPNKFCVLSHRFFREKPEVFRQMVDGTMKPVEKGFVPDY